MKCPHCNHPLSRVEVARLLGSEGGRPGILTDEQRQHIRKREHPAKHYAEQYGISESLVYAIWQGKR